MSALLPCPSCQSEYTYEDHLHRVCSMCGFQWDPNETSVSEDAVVDANGTPLQDGDDVTVIKDLKVSGASGSIKRGTKVKNIKVLDNPKDGHNINCRVDGFGAMQLKSEFVKKL